MIPYFWGDVPIRDRIRGGASGVTFSSLLRDDLGLRDLPADVRAQMENHSGEIRTPEELEALVTELMIQQ